MAGSCCKSVVDSSGVRNACPSSANSEPTIMTTKVKCLTTCCDEKSEAEISSSSAVQSSKNDKTTETNCRTSCCDAEIKNEEQTSVALAVDQCKREEPKNVKSEGCCEPRKSPVCEAKPKGCCSPKIQAGDDKSKSCCSTESSTEDSNSVSDCCPTKKAADINVTKVRASPCCDTSCVERIAARECEKRCGKKPMTGTIGDSPCNEHKRTTRSKYAAKLSALECICRALIAMGEESCCVTKSDSTVRRRQMKPALNGDKRSSSESFGKSCSASAVTQSSGHQPILKGCTSATNQASVCCKPAAAEPATPKCASKSACAKSREVRSDQSDEPRNGTRGFVDLEKGTGDQEHVVLNIEGMTCSGCETKLQRTLGTLPALTNLKTSLVLGRVEFNLDTATMSCDSVMRHLEKKTEFKCERLTTGGISLDLIVPDVDAFLAEPMPKGATEMKLVGKKTQIVRINYDAQIVGARQLLAQLAEGSYELAPPAEDPGLVSGARHVRNMGYTTLLSIVLTVPILVLAWAPLEERPLLYGGISLALATIIQVAIAGPFYPKAVKSLIFSRVLEMDLLIVLSTSAAYIFSVVSFAYLASGRPLSTGEFFETSALLVTLIMLGRWAAAYSRQKAVASFSLRSLQPNKVILVHEDGSDEQEIDSRLLGYGDHFKVLPEHRVPTDGVVTEGTSEIDESMLTGESVPVQKQVGSKVIAGSINGSRSLMVKLTRLPSENSISIIAGMVDDAKLSKPKMQDMADRVASWFIPTIMVLTTLTFVTWVGVGVAVQHESGSDAAIQAISYAITVLIVSCPCAIGLAIPMVIVVSSGVAAKRGVLYKTADSIESACKITHVVLDKTGTLTMGKLSIMQSVFLDNEARARKITLSLVADSKHPVSSAVRDHFKEAGTTAAKITDAKTVAGCGVEGIFAGKVVRGGNARWLDVETNPSVQNIIRQGQTVFCVRIDGELIAVFGLSDTVRPEAANLIAELRRRKIHISVLSGDEQGAVENVAAQVALQASEVRARCSPQDKSDFVAGLQTQSASARKKRVVAFVGDGTNDAVALAQANIGIHMSSGTDIASSAADVVLVRPNLDGILTTIDISRAAVRRIKLNFTWSFVYNVLALLFASGALVAARSDGAPISIPPQYAGLGELVSVLPVILVALSLRWIKI